MLVSTANSRLLDDVASEIMVHGTGVSNPSIGTNLYTFQSFMKLFAIHTVSNVVGFNAVVPHDVNNWSTLNEVHVTSLILT